MDLLQLLCEPKTKKELFLKGTNLEGGIQNYPVVKGVPVILEDICEIEKAVEIIEKGNAKIGYSWALSHWHDLDIDGLIGESKIQDNRLLNFGSGSPLEKQILAEKGYHVVSMDINAGYSGVDIIADGHNLPFKDRTFQTVTAFEVLEHLHEPWNAIMEINRVLCIGGRFVGSVAFLKEFHNSYFHMSHWGVIKLLKFGGFEIERIYGGQNIFSRLIHNVFPIGPTSISKFIYNLISGTFMLIRKVLWSTKKGEKYNTPLDKFDKLYKFSFEEFDRIKFAPTVLFSATKVRDV